jgi:GNAT superfamily N-acetyltransferase
MAQDPHLTVRPLRAEDRAPWGALWAAYLDFYGTSRPPAQADLTFGRLLAGAPGPFRGFAAETQGTLVGIAHAILHPTCWEAGPVCYLQDLFTRADRRGAGIGRALIAAVGAMAAAEGAAEVYWLTAETNYPGRMLYDRVGARTPFIVYNLRAA